MFRKPSVPALTALILAAAACPQCLAGEAAAAATTRMSQAGEWKVIERSFNLEVFNARAAEFVFSSDRRRFAYATCEKSGLADRVILDGVKQKQYDSVGGLIFSPDSEHFAYCAKENDKEFAVLDGIEGKKYDDSPYPLVFSPDSRHLAYSLRSAGGDRDVLFVLDGSEIPLHGPHGGSDRPLFSPDSKHWAYSVFAAGWAAVYFDGKQILEADKVPFFGLQFSPDSTRLAAVYMRGDKWFVACGQDTYGPYDKVDEFGITFSPDSQRLAIPACIEGQWFLICGKEKHGPYGLKPQAAFSPNGKSMSWIGGKEGDFKVYLDGRPLATVKRAGFLDFSPDGKHLVFGGEIGDQVGELVLFVDGIRAGGEGYMVDFLYSHDAQRLAVSMLKDGKKWVDEGGRQGAPHDDVTLPCFSPDSRHLAYIATDAGHNVVVIDDQKVYEFWGSPLDDVEFTKDNRLRGAALVVSESDLKELDELEKLPYTRENHVKQVAKMRLVLFEILPGAAK